MTKPEAPPRFSGLSATKLALLEKWKHGAPLDGLGTQTISKRAEQGPSPLSFAQQRLWFLNQLEPDGGGYNLAFAIRCTGSLNRAALLESLNAIVRRHDVLRTVFPSIDGSPAQVVLPFSSIELPVLDLRSVPEPDRDRALQKAIREEVQRPFDLARGPNFRTALARLTESEHVLIVMLHHIVADHWSLGLFLRELAEFYTAACQGRPASLSAPPVQYADYAVWQRRWLPQVLRDQLAYWQNQLGGDLPTLELPYDRPRPAVQSFRGDIHRFKIPPSLSSGLHALSQQEHVTQFMILLAAFQVLLSRYSGQGDIVIGAPIANRTRAEIEGLIGLFTNTLVLRTNAGGDPTFRDLLRRVRQVCLDAYANQDLPFEQLVDALQPGRDLTRTPLFQVMLVLQNTPMPALQLPSLNLNLVDMNTGWSRFDLTLFIEGTGNDLAAAFEYKRDLFDAPTIERMAGHFQTLLESIVTDPDRNISRLPLLGEAEKTLLVRDWNDTTAAYPLHLCLHQSIEAQVERTPEAVAVVFRQQQVTYRVLDERSNRLARCLRRRGVGPDVLVAVAMERSVEMVVALLGILKAGGAYLPLDPNYPPERKALILDESDPPVVLTQERLAGQIPASRAEVLCLDRATEEIDRESDGPLEVNITPQNLAYVIYTSGSTGKPKGVMISHGGICNRLLWMQQTYWLSSADRVLQKTPYSFDVSVWEFFWPLMTGARLVMAEPGGHQDCAYLVREIRKQGITTLHFVPSMLQVFGSEPGVEEMPSIRQVFCSGEALQSDLQKRFFTRMKADLHNLYGPTEASVDVTFWQCERDRSRASVPIGRPIANTQIYVLDRHMEPTPIGVPGELHIGGAGLARGYLRQADLTARSFVPNPFGQDPGARLYKTGDLARYRPGGEVEYLGRIDNQIKLRGYRIEPGEVEAALVEHPGTRQAIVLTREVRAGDLRLIAFVVPAGQSAPTSGELRSFLKGKLPDFMVPSVLVPLDTLPLMPNGKVDRRALEAGEIAPPRQSGVVASPRGPIEHWLVTLWAELLGRASIGIHDNFFDLGGHSLLATQVISRIRTTMRVDLPLRRFFEQPTVAGLAACLDQELQTGDRAAATPLEILPRCGAPQLSFAQERLWILNRLMPEMPFYNIWAAVRITGPLNVEILEKAVNEVVRRHEVLRTTFRVDNGRPVQVIEPALDLKIRRLKLDAIAEQEWEEEIRRLATEEARYLFDLERGPLIRFALVELDQTEHVALMTMHHIIADGWSLGVLVREIVTLYSACAVGDPSPLPELSIQYADFVNWQRKWLSGAVLDSQLAYWQRQLSDLQAVPLPADRQRPPIQTFRGAACSFHLGSGLLEQLKLLNRSEGATLFMTLLAAFQVLLARYAGQTDIAVGSPVANRTRDEIEALIGPFTNTIVLRTDLSGNPSFSELLARVRQVCLDAYAHQDLPFEQLVASLGLDRELSRTPLFQVMFVLQNAPMPALEIGGLSLRLQDVETGTAKFDLTLTITERPTELDAVIDFNTDLFDAATIQRMAGYFETLLAGLVMNPEQRISVAPLFTEPERRLLLLDRNGSWAQEGPSNCVHEAFEAQVRLTPEAVAVEFPRVEAEGREELLTYEELNLRANQLAHYLRELGVGPDTLVGVCLDRSPVLIIGITSILKAGGAYVPLDPDYPPERLAFMMADANIAVLLTERRIAGNLPATRAHIVSLDTEASSIAQRSTSNVAGGASPDNLAYVIYTSGSTGAPKGVLVTHKNVVRLFEATRAWFAFDSNDVWSLFHSCAFDFSVWELWGALLYGAKLVIVPRYVNQSPDAFFKLLLEYRVTVLNQTPSAFRQLMRIATASSSATGLALRFVIFGGEALDLQSLGAWVSRFGDQKPQLVNMYGITETTVHVTYRPLTADDVRLSTGSLIGRAIPDLQMYILDPYFQPAPIGVPGELYIGGAGLARGYLNHPDLTADRFVPHPWSDVPGARLYRTGDLARYRPDGDVEYLGRIDHQVKIRGYRIELGEIEARLDQQAGVRESIVMAREDVPGDKRLVAYVAVDRESAPTVGELRESLAQWLPEHMVPSIFVLLDRLPRAPSGKLDRRSLPMPATGRAEDTSTYVPPRTSTEKALAGIWASVLGLERVGTQESFFTIGGNSLLMIQVHCKIRDDLERAVPVIDLFKYPTIRSLAASMEQTSGVSVAVRAGQSRAASRRASSAREQRSRPKPLK